MGCSGMSKDNVGCIDERVMGFMGGVKMVWGILRVMGYGVY